VFANVNGVRQRLGTVPSPGTLLAAKGGHRPEAVSLNLGQLGDEVEGFTSPIPKRRVTQPTALELTITAHSPPCWATFTTCFCEARAMNATPYLLGANPKTT
jgi:hypothetical protein